MPIHTTNYQNTFIEIAEDSPVQTAQIPPVKNGKMTVAAYQYEMLKDHPYAYTSDEVFFQIYALRNEIEGAQWAAERTLFFSKGQPCFRASPLTKQYGWGVHSNHEGKIALFGAETAEYRKFSKEKSVTILKAMRTSRDLQRA